MYTRQIHIRLDEETFDALLDEAAREERSHDGAMPQDTAHEADRRTPGRTRAALCCWCAQSSSSKRKGSGYELEVVRAHQALGVSHQSNHYRARSEVSTRAMCKLPGLSANASGGARGSRPYTRRSSKAEDPTLCLCATITGRRLSCSSGKPGSRSSAGWTGPKSIQPKQQLRNEQWVTFFLPTAAVTSI